MFFLYPAMSGGSRQTSIKGTGIQFKPGIPGINNNNKSSRSAAAKEFCLQYDAFIFQPVSPGALVLTS